MFKTKRRGPDSTDSTTPPPAAPPAQTHQSKVQESDWEETHISWFALFSVLFWVWGHIQRPTPGSAQGSLLAAACKANAFSTIL